jgi:hypothetical protein
MLKPKRDGAGEEPLFARSQLYTRAAAVFIVES